jgi:hypothetical protein
MPGAQKKGRSGQAGTAPSRKRLSGLLEKLENGLAPLVGLGQHCGTGLIEDLVFGVPDHLVRHVGIADAGFGSLHIFGSHVQTTDRVFQPVLVGAKIGSLLVDDLDRLVEGSNGTVGIVQTGQ